LLYLTFQTSTLIQSAKGGNKGTNYKTFQGNPYETFQGYPYKPLVVVSVTIVFHCR